MNYRRIASGFVAFAGVASVLLSSFGPAAAGEKRALIELFTSQGCSSCPAADRLAGELATDPSLIVVSMAVDYWDYLGWKDTLALKDHTLRERAYAAVRGDRQVYTPQVVVNGLVPVLGSDRAAINNAIVKTRESAAPLTVPVTLAIAGDKVSVTVAGNGDARSGEVWLCPVSGKVPVAVGRGENKGRTITYSNVVRNWVKLGDWRGQTQTFTVPVSALTTKDLSMQDFDTVFALVQTGSAAKPGVVLGAGISPCCNAPSN